MATIIPGLYGLDSASAFRALQKDPQKYLDRFAKDKTVQKELDYFNKVAPKFTSVDDLMKDRRALQFVLDSYGMGSEINNAGRIKKVLTEDPTASTSLVNKLVDTKFKAMATALRLDQGMTKLQGMVTDGSMKKGYIQNEFEEALGTQDNALRQAAYFARNTGSISTVYSVLGDKILRDVVTKTFQLPSELAVQEIESQAKVVAKRVDVTKFNTSGTTTVSATQLARAKTDHDLIGANLKISDAALKQVKSLQDSLKQLTTDYTNLTANTDPAGKNAAAIAVQESAVPDLIRYEQLLTAGNSAVTSVQTSLTSLQTLVSDAQKSGSNLANLKTQFSSLINTINTKLAGAAIIAPDGSTQNLLLNGSADKLTTVYDDKGATVSLNRYDVTDLQSLLDEANTAFNGASGNTDSTSFNTALSRLLRVSDGTKAIATQITKDTTALNTASSTGFFVATLNTDELSKGQQSVNDGLSRITKIEDLITKIGALATTSKGMAAGADRSTLETQFATYKTQLRGLIENTGKAGLDNFLNNLPDQNYEIIDGKNVLVKGGFDLANQIASVIESKSLSNATDAAALEIATIQVTTYSTRAKNGLTASKPTIDSAIDKYDPRGKLDNRVLALQSGIDALVAGAAVDGKNLLSSDQKKITLDVSTSTRISFTPDTTFKQDITTALGDIVNALNSGAVNVLDKIDDALDTINRTTRTLTSDNRVATIEYGRLGGTIDALDPQNTTTTSKLYQTNSFTAKFISRYLVLNGSNGSASSGSGSTNYLSSLFGSSDSSAAIGNITSLAVSIKA